MRNIRRLSVVLLTICFGLIGASAALADTQTKVVGDDRGTKFAATCPPGEALTYMPYRYTNMLAGLGAACRSVGPQGFNAGYHLPDVFYGPDGESGTAGVEYNFSFCPNDMAVKALQVFFGDNLVVQSVRLTCHVVTGSKPGVIVARTNVTGVESTTSKSVNCPPGMFATGFVGTYTGGIHSIGLSCHDFSAPAEDPTPDEQTADTGDDGDDENDGGPLVLKGDNGPFQLQITIGPDGVTFGPKGKVRVLREDSTVYSDRGKTPVDYLEAGDKVAVVGCEHGGKGWCQIVAPETRLIWGGDFKK